MIDLKKLEERLDALFEQETEESFAKWLEEKKQKEVQSLLGNGIVETIKILKLNLGEVKVSPSIEDSSNTLVGNEQFAIAA